MKDNPSGTVVLLLPTLPHYRKDFVEKLIGTFQKQGQSLCLMYGTNRLKKHIKCVEIAGCESVMLESGHRKVFGANIGYQKGLVGGIDRVAPSALVCLFNPGQVSHVLALLYCLRKKTPFLLWGCAYERIEANWITRFVRRRIRVFFQHRASGHICYGEELKKELLEKGIVEDRIWVAQNTVNVECISEKVALTNRTVARERCGMKDDETLFLFVGALIPPKNLDALIRAFSDYSQEQPAVKLLIVGDGQERLLMETLCNQLGCERNVKFAGAKYDDELCQYFVAADVFVMPGTGGLAVNEAMAYGLPVIAAEGDGTVSDLVEHGTNGYVLPNQCSPNKIIKALRWYTEASVRGEVVRGKEVQSVILKKASLSNMVEQFASAVMETAKWDDK